MSNAAEMDAQEIINYIATAPKKTPVKLYVREKPGMKVAWGDAHVYGGRRGKTVFGDWDELKAILDANADSIDYYDVENDCRNSAVPMLDLKGINARIEPGAIIRDRVEIGDRAVIMMGAIINIGSVIGEGSMIDMGAVLGGRATVGKNCHIGAGTVLAGVVEPASATPVIIEDDVMIGANAVVLEGVRVGKGAVVAAGAVCVEDVPAGAVVAGVPARVIKMRDAQTDSKTGLEEGLRKLQAALKLAPASKGENVTITVPKDLGLLADTIEPAPGAVCTSPIQTYLDLSIAGERGAEAAEHLRQERLSWPK